MCGLGFLTKNEYLKIVQKSAVGRIFEVGASTPLNPPLKKTFILEGVRPDKYAPDKKIVLGRNQKTHINETNLFSTV